MRDKVMVHAIVLEDIADMVIPRLSRRVLNLDAVLCISRGVAESGGEATRPETVTQWYHPEGEREHEQDKDHDGSSSGLGSRKMINVMLSLLCIQQRPYRTLISSYSL